MSKGTKQIRVGRVARTVENMKYRLEALKDMRDFDGGISELYKRQGMIQELELCIQMLQVEYLDGDINA